MLWIHPIIQAFAIVIAWYVFYLGTKRFRFLHLHQEARFTWKRHVILGEIAFGFLLAGIAGGIIMVYLHWQGFFITGIHGVIGLLMIPFVIFGIISGVYMNYKKEKNPVFPFIHGLNNLVILILALIQVITGLGIVKAFVLGIG